MSNSGELNWGRFIVVTLGLFGILTSLPLLGFAVLGLIGILFDVSVPENGGFGLQLLYTGLPPLIGDMVLCVFGLFALNQNHRHADAEPSARPARLSTLRAPADKNRQKCGSATRGCPQFQTRLASPRGFNAPRAGLGPLASHACRVPRQTSLPGRRGFPARRWSGHVDLEAEPG